MKEDVVATPARLSLGAGSTLSLNHDRLWVIEEGWVEIYLLVDGRRHFAGVFRSGAVLFCVSGDDDALIMLAPEAARLLPLASAELYAAGASDRLVAARIARALDHWITELSRGILKATTQRPVVSTLAAGEAIEVPAGASLAAAQGIVWIPVSAGRNLRFLDEVDLVPGSRVPLSPATWITLGASIALLAHDMSEEIAQGVASVHLRSFHDLLGQLAANRERERSEIGRDSLATSQSFTSESLSSALGRFSGLLTERHAPHVQSECEFLLQKLVPDLPATTKLPPGIEFQAALRMLNIKVREVALTGDWWEQDIGRLAVTRVADGRPVALVTDWLGRYFCYCSGEPRRRVTVSLAADLDTQAASLLAAMPPRQVTAKDLLRTFFRATKRDFFVLVFATGLASLLGLVLPVAIGYVVNTFVPSHMRDDTIVLGAFVAAVTIAVAVLHFCANIARQRMDGIIEAEIGGKAMERILHLPPKTLKTVSAADLAMRFMSLDQVRRAVMNAGLDIMLTGLFGMSGLVLLFVYSPLGGLIVLSLFILLMAVSVFTGLAQLRAITRGNQITANESSLRLQMIQNVSTLRACAAERRAFSHWAGNAAEMRARGLRSRLVNAAFKAFVALYPGVALGAVFLALGTKNSDGLSTGSYLAFLTAYQNFSFASLGVAQSVTQLIGLQPTVKRAAFVLAAEPEILAGAKPPGRLSGAITVSRASFSYSADTPQILREVDFEAKAGEFVAICGGSGSGKSTLLNLLIGFDRPTEGAIYYYSNDLAQLDLAAVRRQIGLVRQTSRLFGGTIAENIIGAQRASLEDAWFAAEMAGIDGDIRLLPMGMHTVITEGVSTFSGGQLQRLMIARALVSKPKIVFLDEATSALDNIVQSEVTRNIERLGATRVVVAHRLSTVRNADRILFLKNGVIAERGSYDELMAANGAFADFNQRQMLTVPHA